MSGRGSSTRSPTLAARASSDSDPGVSSETRFLLRARRQGILSQMSMFCSVRSRLMIVAEQGAARPRAGDARAGEALRARRAARAAVSRGPRAGGVRPRLLLGRRAEVLAGARRLHDGGRLRRRLHAEPDLRRGLLGHDRPHRGRAGRVRSREGRRYERAAAASSGRATTRRRGCARATTSARSTARRSTRRPTRSARPPRRRKSVRGRAGARRLRRDHDRDRAAPGRSTTPRSTTSSTSRRIPNGYCGLGGTGVSCPVGLATQTES